MLSCYRGKDKKCSWLWFTTDLSLICFAYKMHKTLYTASSMHNATVASPLVLSREKNYTSSINILSCNHFGSAPKSVTSRQRQLQSVFVKSPQTGSEWRKIGGEVARTVEHAYFPIRTHLFRFYQLPIFCAKKFLSSFSKWFNVFHGFP